MYLAGLTIDTSGIRSEFRSKRLVQVETFPKILLLVVQSAQDLMLTKL